MTDSDASQNRRFGTAAKEQGISRSEFIRQAIDRELLAS